MCPVPYFDHLWLCVGAEQYEVKGKWTITITPFNRQLYKIEMKFLTIPTKSMWTTALNVYC